MIMIIIERFHKVWWNINLQGLNDMSIQSSYVDTEEGSRDEKYDM